MAYTVSFDAASLIKGLNAALELAIAEAVRSTALTTQAAWQQTVLKTPGLWPLVKQRYADSVKVDYYGMGARIYSDDPMASQIETGIPARDLKKMLNTSPKVRVAKNGPHAGQRYLIIPFRHNTPGNDALGKSMPQDVYLQAKSLIKSSITGRIAVRSGLNASNIRTRGPLTTMRNTYAWGGRLDGQHLPKNLRGMVRFNTSSGDQNSSSYITFRVMGEWSSGWIAPAQPGRYIVKALSEQAQQMLASEVTNAIAAVGVS